MAFAVLLSVIALQGQSAPVIDALNSYLAKHPTWTQEFKIIPLGHEPINGVIQNSPAGGSFHLDFTDYSYDFKFRAGEAIELNGIDKRYQKWVWTEKPSFPSAFDEWEGSQTMPFFFSGLAKEFLQTLSNVKTTGKLESGNLNMTAQVQIGDDTIPFALGVRADGSPEGYQLLGPPGGSPGALMKFSPPKFDPLPPQATDTKPPMGWTPIKTGKLTWTPPIEEPMQGSIHLKGKVVELKSLKKTLVVFVQAESDQSSKLLEDLKSIPHEGTEVVIVQIGNHDAEAWIDGSARDKEVIGLSGTPEMFLIDGKGILQWTAVGYGPKSAARVKSDLGKMLLHPQ